ncbi:MAG: helix-turn-helix domain-containing protein [Emcibacteraceae bacterium]|nr:helix-turn-helix domain-containing protein [Emcibacteraceae bacterium]
MGAQKQYYTVSALSERWQCSGNHVRNLCKERKLGHLRIGSRIRIPHKYVDEYENHQLKVHNKME